MSIAEFFIPQKLTDIEERPDSPNADRYSVECVMDLQDMSESEQVSTLQAILNEISSTSRSSKGSGPIAIFQPSKFDTLYSYVKHIGTLGRESKVLLCTELPQMLKKLCKQIAHILSKRQRCNVGDNDNSPAPEIDSQFHIIARSAIKMYCFLISNIITILDDPSSVQEDGSSVQLSQSQSSRSRSRGRPASQPQNTSVIDLSAKEGALTSLLELLSSDISPIWSKNSSLNDFLPKDSTRDAQFDNFSTPVRSASDRSGALHGQLYEIDDGVLQTVFKVLLKMLNKKSNLFEIGGSSSRTGEITAVGHVVQMLLVALNYHFVKSSDAKEVARIQLELISNDNALQDETEPRNSNHDANHKLKNDIVNSYFRFKCVGVDVRDEIISPLCELMIKHDYVSKFLAASVHMIDRDTRGRESDENFMTQPQWSTVSVQSEAEDIAGGESRLLSDTPGLSTSALQAEGSGEWQSRFLRGLIESIAESCGIVPIIVEDEDSTQKDENEIQQENPEVAQADDDIDVENPAADRPAEKIKHWKVAYVASANANIDAHACKNLVVFFEYLSDHHISIIHRNFDLLKPLLNCSENYDIRKAMVSALIEIAIAKHSRLNRLKAMLSRGSPGDSDAYKHACESYLETLNALLTRLMDTSFVVRTHCIKGFALLWERKVLPLPYQLKVLENIVLRLEDRNNHTRKAAFGLVSTAIANNNFTGKYLSLKRITSKLELHRENGENEPRNSVSMREASMSNMDEDPGSPNQPRMSFSTMSEFSAVQGDSTVVEDMPADRLALADDSTSDKNMKLKYYAMGIQFIESIHKAVEAAYEMLQSKVLADVLEAIELISKANELRVDIATEESYKIFPLIYSDEPTVQEAIRGAFCTMMFAQFRRQTNIPLMYRNIACIRTLMRMLMTCSEGIIAAVETICQQLSAHKPTQGVITDDILSTVWGIAVAETDTLRSSLKLLGDTDPESAEICYRRYGMQLFSILVLANPRSVRDRIPEIVQEVLPKRSNDIIMCCYLFQSVERLSLIKSFALLPWNDPLIAIVAQQIVRQTSQINAWLMMAERGLALVSALCDNAYDGLTFILKSLEARVMREIQPSVREGLSMPSQDNQHQGNVNETTSPDPADNQARAKIVLTQFVFALGHVALKQYVHIDSWERSALSQVECGSEITPLFRTNSPIDNTANNQAKPKKRKNDEEPTDAMKSELGFDSKDYKREEVRETAEKAREELMGATSIFRTYLPALTQWAAHFLQEDQQSSGQNASQAEPTAATEILSDAPLRTAAMLTLIKFMMVNEGVCRQNIRLLFTILKESPHWWVRTNILVGIGDLLCVHPNIVQPYMHPSQGHITSLLDPSTEKRTRSTTVTICTHLALSDMLRIPDMTPYILALIGDDDPSISNMGICFLHELHSKNKTFVYNFLPVVCMYLCKVYKDNEEKFIMSMRLILEKIEKDKQAESTIEKLCAKFPPFSSSGTTEFDVTVARYLAFCLSELNYSSDKVLNMLCSETSFHYYRRWLTDEKVRRLFATIGSKARRSGHTTATVDEADVAPSQSQRAGSTRSGNDRRSRTAVLDEWESRITAFLESIADHNDTLEQGTVSEQNNNDEEESQAQGLQEAQTDVSINPKQEKNEGTDSDEPVEKPAKRMKTCLDPEQCDDSSE